MNGFGASCCFFLSPAFSPSRKTAAQRDGRFEKNEEKIGEKRIQRWIYVHVKCMDEMDEMVNLSG